MSSLDEISERLEIQQLLVDYSTAIDRRRSRGAPEQHLNSTQDGGGPVEGQWVAVGGPERERDP
jgi:hypothetical protein